MHLEDVRATASSDGKKKRKKKHARLEMRGREQGEWGQTKSVNNGVKLENTVPVMDAVLEQSAFERGRGGGASCWQCQGPYRFESASATETND